MDYTYGLYIYESVTGLGFVGPADVFIASTYILQKGRVVLISENPGAIRCLGGMEVVPGATIETAPPLDLLVVPGADNMEKALAFSDKVAGWIRSQAKSVKFMTAVSSGSLILQKLGLLTNRKATTHWLTTEELAKDPTIEVMPEMRYVRDGNILTTQGVSAGIDMALWAVGQLHSHKHAREVRRLLQYDPAPPYAAEV